jgi:hypothetical protein
VEARAEAFDALEAVQRECVVYVADHSASQRSDGGDSAEVWEQALTHVLGSKDWWDAHYGKVTSHAGPPAPLCSELKRRTLAAYAAVSFTAVDEMQRQLIEQRLFGEVTRPKAPSPAWVALAAIGQEVRNAVGESRCPDDKEAFNAWSVVSFYVVNTRGDTVGVGDAVAPTRLELRNFAVPSLPRRPAGRPLDGVPAYGTARFAGSRWMRWRKNPRLRGA